MAKAEGPDGEMLSLGGFIVDLEVCLRPVVVPDDISKIELTPIEPVPTVAAGTTAAVRNVTGSN